MDFAPDCPRWRQVADVIRQRIADGTYAPGTRVPSVLNLSAEFGIATSTSQKVHRALRANGLIRTRAGMGSFVARELPVKPSEKPTEDPADG
ncbi:GntR family transcriptional regulator [Streptomyces ochraceiscleroticus]|uniref:GntR family transcriptional regulator n=1 Tax=Streptomyces ochraceiscleroticus TaxID=47761 RepID=A0ABW1MM72_9ACTN|nr:winged helix-turn-helix domain-containing protein [Streptomyces ochraceiscleroticus]